MRSKRTVDADELHADDVADAVFRRTAPVTQMHTMHVSLLIYNRRGVSRLLNNQ